MVVSISSTMRFPYLGTRILKLGMTRPLTQSAPPLSSSNLPMKLFGLDGRYAMALYSAASKKNVLDKVEDEMNRIVQYLSKHPEVREMMEQPIFNRKQTIDMVKSLLGKNHYHEITCNFFNLLAENGRLRYTYKILESFGVLMSAHRGEIQAIVTSAKELPSNMVEQLSVALKKGFIQPGQTLKVTTRRDPTILGGLIVEVGDKTLDLSVATKLKRLNQLLAETMSY
jgi:F-type H+-transporting ATPase subunit O